MAIFHDQGVNPRVVQRVQNTEVLLALVASGMGYSIVLSGITHSSVGSDVVLRPLAGVEATMETWMAWRDDETREVVRNFVESARHG
jgi:DNA-binding transcriptional LysR family regulator